MCAPLKLLALFRDAVVRRLGPMLTLKCPYNKRMHTYVAPTLDFAPDQEREHVKHPHLCMS
eukprot:4396370-Amphidinium_carterae.1